MEELENNEIMAEETPPKRSTALLILCILTFINSGYSFLYYLLLPLAKEQLPAMYAQFSSLLSADAAMQAQFKMLLDFLCGIPSWKYILTAIPYAIAVVGAACMLNLKKVGFHLYIIAQIFSFICINFLIGGLLKMNFTDILWTVIFILLYFGQLKKVKVL